MPRMGARHAWLAAATLAVTLCACFAWSTPALALLQRGHTFSSSFGPAVGKEGALSEPSGVAVNESTGDVYVVDRANNRVERFNAAGKFLAAWGWGVKDGAKEYEICESGEGCKAGLAPTGTNKEKFHVGAGQLVAPEEIAVDNSGGPSEGDVYVVGDVVGEKSYVDKYGPTGEYMKRLTKKEETESFPGGRVEGVAVDSKGVVWVDWSENEITSYTDAEANKRTSEEELTPEAGAQAVRPWLAVDSADNLYVNFEPSEKFEEGEENVEGKGENGEAPCAGSTCFISKLTSTEILNEATGKPLEAGEALTRGIDGGAPRARPMSVDLSNNDLYVDSGTSVAAYDSTGTLIQRFGSGSLSDGSGIAIDSKTGAVYVADAATGLVDVFGLEPAGKPRIDELSAAHVTSEAGSLGAEVDPAGGADTTVTFEYGPASCAGAPCTSVAYGKTLSGFGDQAVSVELTGLTPSTTYYYRVTAANKEFGSVTSEEKKFTTQPPVTTFSLSDNRAWEMVSPAQKNGVGIESSSFEGGLIQASESGNAITYITTGPSEAEPEGNRSPAFTQNLATRSEAGPSWTSKEIAIPYEHALGDNPGKLQEYLIFSPDLSLALLEPRGRNPQSEPALSSEATEKTIYIRHNEGCAPPPSSCYQPLVTPASDTAEPELGFGGPAGAPATGVHFLVGTPDLSHAVISSEVPLTKEVTVSGTNFYEWTAGKPPAEQLQLINLLPGNTPVAARISGETDNSVRGVISNDGTRIVFSAAGHLYLRDTATATTVQIDTPEAGVTVEAGGTPRLQTSSGDGTKIFFTDNRPLTKNSLAASEAPDLFEYDATTGVLSDLTPGNEGEPAVVRNLIAGASEDGTTVYFVANGVLSKTANAKDETATPGDCADLAHFAVPGATCNLYVEHLGGSGWETPKFIAALANEDSPDWGESIGAGLGLSALTARVAPNGQYLAFMSERSLTGYDNRDANPASKGAPAEEVFRYDDEGSGTLDCVSCDPTGARPEGVLDVQESSEGAGLLIDRPGIWEGRWIAGDIPGWTRSEQGTVLYQPRYLNDSGRLFFDAADDLVPADVNGENDVYEYESSGEGSCASAGGCVGIMSSGTSERETAFLDASASGNDVFFLTAAPLVTTDHDTNFDVYDARVCTAGSPCVAPPASETAPCDEANNCKPPETSAPAYVAPATTAPSGLGNLTAPKVVPPKTQVLPNKVAKLTQKQKLAKALKLCKKLKKKSSRVSCERRVHKRYPLKKAEKSTKGKK